MLKYNSNSLYLYCDILSILVIMIDYSLIVYFIIKKIEYYMFYN